MTTRKSVRIFVRVGVTDLETWLAGGDVDLAGRGVQAVTDRARQALPDDDEEELEYAALWWAAAAAPARENAASGRLVVAALGVPIGLVQDVEVDDPDRGFEVAVRAPLSRRHLAALHVADGPPDDEDAELSWYDASELAQVASFAG